jgi:hypothetical protein
MLHNRWRRLQSDVGKSIGLIMWQSAWMNGWIRIKVVCGNWKHAIMLWVPYGWPAEAQDRNSMGTDQWSTSAAPHGSCMPYELLSFSPCGLGSEPCRGTKVSLLFSPFFLIATDLQKSSLICLPQTLFCGMFCPCFLRLCSLDPHVPVCGSHCSLSHFPYCSFLHLPHMDFTKPLKYSVNLSYIY